MFHWFTWKNKSSLKEFDLWIGKLPKITRAPERHQEIKIPGRPGSLILLEGEYVYDSYEKECTVITRNTNPKIQEALEWLTGSGDVVFSNEIDKAYEARIISPVEFARIGNSLLQAKIVFFCEPLKKQRNESAVSFSASGTIKNPGDVPSKPQITFTASGNQTITVNGKTLTLNNMPGGETLVDCENKLILVYAQAYNANAHYYIGEYATYNGNLYRFTSEGIGSLTTWEQVAWDGTPFRYIWPGNSSGEFPTLNTGANTITPSMEISVLPRWRWV